MKTYNLNINLLKKNILFVFVLLFSFSSFSQIEKKGQRTASDTRLPLSKLLIKSSFRLPNVTSNTFLKENSDGIADISLGLNYGFYKNFYVGLGYRYSNFQISDKKLRSNPKEQLNADIHQYGIYGELSYFISLGGTFTLETNIQAGENNIFITSTPCSNLGEKGIAKKGLFYSPNVIFYLRGEENLSFNLTIGYTFTNNNFKPEDVCKTEFKDYETANFEPNYQYINIGFGITYSFQKN